MFVTRDSNKNINGVYYSKQFDNQEFVDDNNKEIKEFMNPKNVITPQTKYEEVIKKEIEMHETKAIFSTSMGNITLDYSDNTYNTMILALDGMSTLHLSSITTPDSLLLIKTLTVQDVESIKAELLRVRNNLHNQTIIYVNKIAVGDLDFVVDYSIT